MGATAGFDAVKGELAPLLMARILLDSGVEARGRHTHTHVCAKGSREFSRENKTGPLSLRGFRFSSFFYTAPRGEALVEFLSFGGKRFVNR